MAKGKTIHCGDLTQFKRWVSYLNSKKERFKTIQYGSVAKIIFEDGHCWAYSNNESYLSNPKVGYMCRMVSKDIKQVPLKELENKENYSPIKECNPKVIRSIINDDSNKNKHFVAVDIISCYWNIAFKKGFISEKTFKKGENLKLERNISLGSLNKRIHEIEYSDGKKKNETKYNSETGAIWNEILKEVSIIYSEILSIIPLENYIGWETDCIYFSDSKIELFVKVRNYLNKKGIEFNYYLCYFLGMDNISARYVLVNSPKGQEKEFYLGGRSERKPNC